MRSIVGMILLVAVLVACLGNFPVWSGEYGAHYTVSGLVQLWAGKFPLLLAGGLIGGGIAVGYVCFDFNKE